MKLILFIALVSALSVTGAIATALPLQYKTSPDANATFHAVGKPSLLKIDGQGAKLDGTLKLDGNQATGKFALDLTGFDTGIETRTEHMKTKYLETQKFPKAFLTLDKVELPSGFKPGDTATANFTGQLTLKDVTKPVNGTVKIEGGTMTSQADFAFKLSDFPVGVPTYMGVTVADDVKVHVAIPSFAKETVAASGSTTGPTSK